MAGRSSALKDTLVALGIVAAVLLGLYAYAGTWPPMVVVESGSMMHCDPGEEGSRCPPGAYATGSVPWGRIGTIDPGDLVVVKEVETAADIELWVDGFNPDGTLKGDADIHYGEPGDVIIYRPNGDPTATPIIHRAITHVKAKQVGGETYYDVKWWNGTLTFKASSGIVIREPSKGISINWHPPANGPREGYLTKGDNPITNTQIDQETSISRYGAVDFRHVQGVARLELPWFGLIKLAISGKVNEDKCEQLQQFHCRGWWKIIYAWAPSDLWVGLFVSLTVLIVTPFAIDFAQAKIRERRDAQDPPPTGPETPPPPGPAEPGPPKGPG